MSYEAKLKELGIELPEAPKPVAAYVSAVRAGGFVYTSGQITMQQGVLKYVGKVGQDLTVEEGYQAARICALNALSAVRAVAGSLDNIEQIVKVVGFVNSADGFTEQPKVINGASELLRDIFGSAGQHARSAVGANELPLNTAVEIEMIVKVRN